MRQTLTKNRENAVTDARQYAVVFIFAFVATGPVQATQSGPVIYKCSAHGQPVFQDQPCPGESAGKQQTPAPRKTYDVAALERRLDRLQAMGVGLRQATLPPTAPPDPPQIKPLYFKPQPRLSWGERDALLNAKIQRMNAQSEHNNAVSAAKLGQGIESAMQACGGQLLDYPQVGMSDQRFRQCTKLARFGSITQVVVGDDNGVPLRLYVFSSGKIRRVYSIDGVVADVKP